ncbi:cytochrome P450 [Lentzea atacamensis]|uniref:cytochrome P450 n=1 Tax=Lentzea atacamensis TaxID=531938 RepID=UPI0014742796|nr:cytochrome P450 [Lentzea atacamensis]
MDLGDPAAYVKGPPFELWDRMRADAPIQHSTSAYLGIDFWSVTGYHEIRSVLSDGETFASRYGAFLGFGPQTPDPAGQRMLVVTDGPRRQALRSTMQRYFSPQWAKAHRSGLAEKFRAALSERDDVLDFASDYAWRIPMLATCSSLSLPEMETDRLCALTDGVLTEEGVGAIAARAEIFAYFRKLVEARKDIAIDDVVAAMLSGVSDGALSTDDVVLNLLSLLVAGNETSRLALTGAVVAFAQHPDQWDRLRRCRELIPKAVDEILRWTSPGLHVSRTVLQDAEIGGVNIPSGATVAAWLPAGNRDPIVFDEPHIFDVGRNGRPHLSMGHGPHHCIGAALSRVEVAALLDATLDSVEAFELVSPPRYTNSITVSGFTEALVRLH